MGSASGTNDLPTRHSPIGTNVIDSQKQSAIIKKTENMRTKNSCRFAPYYKVEKWNDSTQCWSPIQKSFPTIELAQKKAGKFNKSRIIRRSENGTEVLP